MSSGRPLTAGQRKSSMRFRRCGYCRLMTQAPSQSPARRPYSPFNEIATQQRRIVTLGETPPSGIARAEQLAVGQPDEAQSRFRLSPPQHAHWLRRVCVFPPQPNAPDASMRRRQHIREWRTSHLAVYSNSEPPDRVRPRLPRTPKCPDKQTSQASLPHGESVPLTVVSTCSNRPARMLQIRQTTGKDPQSFRYVKG